MRASVHVRQQGLILIVGAPPWILCELIQQLSILVCPPPLLLSQPLFPSSPTAGSTLLTHIRASTEPN